MRAVQATSELTASFMANGYARASGKTAVLCTIAGPGVTFASSGLAEARLDSVPLVHIVDAGRKTSSEVGSTVHVLPQVDLLSPLAKCVIEARSAAEVAAATRAAFASARHGEPGPVVLQIQAEALRGLATTARHEPDSESITSAVDTDVESVAERLLAARRPLLLVGMGAASASYDVSRLAERLTAPVLSTTSGRGVVSERHTLSLAHDVPGGPVKTLNEVVARADIVLALGCKLSQNGSRGYALVLPCERLVRIDSSRAVLEGGYPASHAIEADVGEFVSALIAMLGELPARSEWTVAEIESVRSRLAAERPARLNPRLAASSASVFFGALRRQLPDDAVVTTDSGLHQYLVRVHFPVLAPRTLLVPTNFQSMGFGIPAAIGAGIATGKRAVAVTGDGGLDIVGLELLTAVREQLPLTVVVLVDGYLGLIRLSQLARTGRETGVDVAIPRLETFARSLDVDYAVLDGSADADQLLGAALASGRVTIIEIPVGDPPDVRWLKARGRVFASLRGVLGDRAVEPARRVRRRR